MPAHVTWLHLKPSSTVALGPGVPTVKGLNVWARASPLIIIMDAGDATFPDISSLQRQKEEHFRVVCRLEDSFE